MVWLCDCRCLTVEGDPVCGATQVLFDHRPPAAGCFVLSSPNYRATLHRAKVLLNPSSSVCRSACSPRFPRHAGVDDGRPFGMRAGPSRLALLAQALSANTRLRVRPFDHGIKLGDSRPGAQVPVWALSMKPSSSGPRSGGQSRLDVIFVAQHKLRAVPDPPRLRVGLKCTPGSSGRSSEATLFGPVLRH